MDSISSTLNLIKPNPSNSLKKTISSALVYILVSSATTYLLILLHSSPRFLWITANAIIVFIYKFSSSDDKNHSENQPELITTIPSASFTSHEHPNPIISEEKNRGYIKTTTEENESFDDTWKGIRMGCGSAENKKSYLKKSDTWEMRWQPRLQRKDKVGLKRELKKSATYTERRERESKRDSGWRTRDVLVLGHDELFRRVENFIKKQHDHLRLQGQESEHTVIS